MKIVPLFANLHVKVEEEKKSVGEIDLPDNSNADSPQTGTVTAKGDEAAKVQVGDRVIFKKYSPETLKLNGEEVTLLAESDVIAVITE